MTSSDEMGVCYVETSNLDGFNKIYTLIIIFIRERNLKCKQSVETIRKEIQTSSVRKLNGKIIYESPNNMIHHFKGMCYLNHEREPLFINNDQILLRVYYYRKTIYIFKYIGYYLKEHRMDIRGSYIYRS